MSSVGTDYGKTTSTAYQREQAEKEAAGKGGVSKTDFLKLLTTQLTNQDPLNPTQDIDFTAQLAQLQALDEQMAMTKTMKALRTDSQMQAGTAMIGKYISGTDAAGNTASGQVMRLVSTKDGVFCELANKQKVPVENINNVWNDANSMNNDLANSGNVIGMWVEAGYDDAFQPIRGIVESVSVKNGQVYLTLYGGKSVTWDKVTSMRTPTEEEVWYMLPDSIREKVETAQGMVKKAVTGKDANGNVVTGIVGGAKLDGTNVILTLLTGEQINIDTLSEEPRKPTVEEVAKGLNGYWIGGLDKQSNTITGIAVGAEEFEDGIAVILDNGQRIYFDAVQTIEEATSTSQGRMHGMYAEGKTADGEEVSGFIVKKLTVDGQLAVELSNGKVVLCKDLTLTREPTEDEKEASKKAVEDAKNS